MSSLALALEAHKKRVANLKALRKHHEDQLIAIDGGLQTAQAFVADLEKMMKAETAAVNGRKKRAAKATPTPPLAPPAGSARQS